MRRVPSVVIELDKTRLLVADMNALEAFHDKTGHNVWDCPMWKEGKDMVVGNHTTDIHAMLWAFLLHDDPAITYEYVGSLYTWADIIPIFEKLLQAFQASAPVESPPKKAPRSQGPGTG